MSSFELDLARTLVERSGERLEGVLVGLQGMTHTQNCPVEVRHMLRQVLHDLSSVRKFVERHWPASEVAGDPA